MNRGARVLGWTVPFVVSGGVFAFLLSRRDAGAVLSSTPPGALLTLVPALLAFGAGTSTSRSVT